MYNLQRRRASQRPVSERKIEETLGITGVPRKNGLLKGEDKVRGGKKTQSVWRKSSKSSRAEKDLT